VNHREEPRKEIAAHHGSSEKWQVAGLARPAHQLPLCLLRARYGSQHRHPLGTHGQAGTAADLQHARFVFSWGINIHKTQLILKEHAVDDAHIAAAEAMPGLARVQVWAVRREWVPVSIMVPPGR
jgi:hypothetical protein